MKKTASEPAKKRRHRTFHPRITPGAAPGTFSPLPGSASPNISVIAVSGSGFKAPRAITDPDELPKPDPKSKTSYWVRVTGLGELAPLLALRDVYGFDDMAFEDLLSPGWRSKMETSGNYLFFVLQTPHMPGEEGRCEHLCLFYQDNLVISFEDSATTLVDSLWQRLSSWPGSSRILHPAAYFTYAVLDMIIDRFYPLLDQKDEALAELEESLSKGIPGREDMSRLHHIKRDLITLRRLLAPYKEIGIAFKQHGTSRGAAELSPYLADLGDHILQAAELVETYHELSNSLDSIFQSMMTNRLNDIIKLLTMISTIFIPLTFIAGIYGMNFDPAVSSWNMPELRAEYGYPITLVIMGLIVAGMVWFFKKKRWF